MALTFVEAPPAPETANFLLYGPPKSGKSTAAATAPSPILWINSEGPNALDFARKVARARKAVIHEVRVERTADAKQLLRDVVEHVRRGTEPRPQTIVIDTMAKLRDALARRLVQPGSKNSMQQWQEVARILRETVQILRDADVNLVIIAHQDVADAEGERIVRPLIGGVLTEEIPGEVDVVAYTHSFVDDESGERRYVGQLVEAKGRIAGDRSGALGVVRQLDLSEWLHVYRDALSLDARVVDEFKRSFNAREEPQTSRPASPSREPETARPDSSPEAGTESSPVAPPPPHAEAPTATSAAPPGAPGGDAADAEGRPDGTEPPSAPADGDAQITEAELEKLTEFLGALGAREAFWRMALLSLGKRELAELTRAQAHELMERAKARFGARS